MPHGQLAAYVESEPHSLDLVFACILRPCKTVEDTRVEGGWDPPPMVTLRDNRLRSLSVLVDFHGIKRMIGSPSNSSRA
jgi:hypothetical protein